MDYFGSSLVEWEFQEYEKFPKHKKWFFGLGAIAGFFLIIAVFTFNFLFALIIILATLILMLHYNRDPLIVKFTITDLGIIMGDNFMPYKDLNRFWVVYDPPIVKKLYFQRKSGMYPTLIIPLQDINPLYVRDILLKNLKEDLTQEDESFAELVGRLLKL